MNCMVIFNLYFMYIRFVVNHDEKQPFYTSFSTDDSEC